MFRWGFIGSSGIVEKVAKELIKVNDQKIVAVYSRNFEKCKAFASKFGGTPYKSFEELLEDKNIDGIYVATPHSKHFFYTKRALEKKIPVLCEKSLTLGSKSTKELFRIAEENNTYLAEAMWTWFNPTAIKAREWYKAGKIGKCLGFAGKFVVPTAIFGGKERLFNPKFGGGSLLDLGVYPVTYAYCLFGKPNDVSAKSNMKNGCDYYDKITLKYDGFKCDIRCGFTGLGTCPVVIKGESGVIKVGPVHHEARKAILKGKNKETFIDNEPIGCYAREFVLCSKEIQNGLKESQYVPKKQTIEVMEIMEAIKEKIGLIYPDDIE